MQTINLADLNPEQQKELIKQAQELNKKRAAEKRQKEEEYKKFVDDIVVEKIADLRSLSNTLATAKKHIYDDFAAVIDIKNDMYPKSVENESHTFTTSDGKYRITLGCNMIDNYDDTASAGIDMVKSYINSFAKDKDTRELVNAVLRLLAKDQNGTLKASRVMQLEKIALESGNEDFLEGVRIIKAAYKPIQSKQYVRAQYKGEQNEWINIPLGMTEA